MLVPPALLFASLLIPAAAQGQPGETADARSQPSRQVDEDDVHGGHRAIGREAAEETDVALLADARGWTKAQASGHRRIAQRFGAVQAQVASERPDLYAGAQLSNDPTGAPILYIKGAADAFVRKVVNDAGIAIQLSEGRALSWSELENKSRRLHGELARRGYRNIATALDETKGTVEGTVSRMPGLPETAQALHSSLSAEFQAGTHLRVDDAPVGGDLHAYGGMWVRDDGFNECTSGFAVVNGSGTTGVTTAGHCDGINEIDEPGFGVFSLTHQNEHRGAWGDIEWKTATAHIEPAEFYASATEVRQVNAVEPRASITVGEAICVYGRSSNSRYCGSTVHLTSVSCTVNGFFNDRLVAMNNNSTTIGGDSGGGWTFGTTAYGSVKGVCTYGGAPRNIWSVADLYDEALGVSVRVV